eukprot:TRINITY_DN3786_c0_g1_i2.p1 TRINITY_DN3786_c0_g1~~TRINITY_DN3786_c0_g1_i2.p1  ORF type:complete len:487 (+),score=99.95 TRINITY_DN3786_c0_g1_i2:159-1619(+)
MQAVEGPPPTPAPITSVPQDAESSSTTTSSSVRTGKNSVLAAKSRRQKSKLQLLQDTTWPKPKKAESERSNVVLLGRYAHALEQAREWSALEEVLKCCVEEHTRVDGPDSDSRVEGEVALGLLQLRLGRPSEAYSTLTEALHWWESVEWSGYKCETADVRSRRMELMEVMCSALEASAEALKKIPASEELPPLRGRSAEEAALDLLTRSLNVLEAAHESVRSASGDVPRHRLFRALCLIGRAAAKVPQRRPAEALAAYTRALQLARDEWGLQHPKTLAVLGFMADEAAALGRHQDAADTYLQIADINAYLFGGSHTSVAAAQVAAAEALCGAGNHAQAERLCRTALASDEACVAQLGPCAAMVLAHDLCALGSVLESGLGSLNFNLKAHANDHSNTQIDEVRHVCERGLDLLQGAEGSGTALASKLQAILARLDAAEATAASQQQHTSTLVPHKSSQSITRANLAHTKSSQNVTAAVKRISSHGDF